VCGQKEEERRAEVSEYHSTFFLEMEQKIGSPQSPVLRSSSHSPTLIAILYSEFDPIVGPKLSYQAPAG
jgi:hypothetical protein